MGARVYPPPTSCAKRLGVRRAAPLWMKFLRWTSEETKAALRAALQGASRKRLPFRFNVEVVQHVNPIRPKAIDAPDLRPRGRLLEPGRRAPSVLSCDIDETVFHGVLMHVVQSSQIRPFVRQPRFPEIVPDPAARRTVESIHPIGKLRVKNSEHSGQILGFCGVSYEMIMIRKDSPSLEAPFKLGRDFQKPSFKYIKAFGVSEVGKFAIRAGRDDKGSTFR